MQVQWKSKRVILKKINTCIHVLFINLWHVMKVNLQIKFQNFYTYTKDKNKWKIKHWNLEYKIRYLWLPGFKQIGIGIVSWKTITANTHLQVQYLYTCKPSQTSFTKIYRKQCHFTLFRHQTISPHLFFSNSVINWSMDDPNCDFIKEKHLKKKEILLNDVTVYMIVWLRYNYRFYISFNFHEIDLS